MDLYNKLLWRDMVKDVSNEEEAKRLLNEEKVRFYVGYDPTGESLTVGHLVQIVRMKFMQNHGHTPVVIIGGGTGLIGDPRETSERKLLTVEKSLHNAKMIEKQIRRLLGDNALYINNYDWLSKIDLIAFLRDYGKHFNVSYMLAKETVSKRLETGISYTEFSYMILQSIDWLHLYQNYDVKIQFGGSDQWGNLTAGLDLMRKVIGKNDAVALSSPLLLKADGAKFGKSETGTIWIDKDLTTPYELYQYFLNTSDEDILTYLKLLTTLEKEENEELLEESNINKELRIAQKRLAEEVVLFVHGKKSLETALKVSDSLFSGDFSNLHEEDYDMLVNVLDTVNINKDNTLTDVLKETKLASSNREAREFINNGAISINGNIIKDVNYNISQSLMYNKYIILRRGKKRYALAILND